MINESGKWFFITPIGGIHEGDDPPPPNGSTLFAAPGGPVDSDLAARYKMTERLGAPTVRRDAAGRPLAEHAGRAYAADALLADDPARKAVEAAAKAEDEAKAKKAGPKAGPRADVKAASDDDDDAADEHDGEPGVKVKAESKAVHRDDPAAGVEDKAVHKPADAKRAPTRPGARGK